MTSNFVNDAQALAFVTAQAYNVNQRVYEAKFPDWDFGRLAYVDTSGNPWTQGVITYTSDFTGKAGWQTGGDKGINLVNVSQDAELRTVHLGDVGYQYNIEEINAAIQIGGSLPDRRARAARIVYTKFMYDLALFGAPEKGYGGITNYQNVPATVAPADGTGGSPLWVNSAGVGLKTPAQIVRDINIGLQGVNLATLGIELADTVLLPVEALNYIASTPYSATTMETILSFVLRTNIYTLTTGRPLTVRAVRELGTAGTAGAGAGKGRMVVYKNDQDYIKILLPMPHRFLPVYQDGPLNWTVPGIFRTGGLDVQNVATFRYIDAISETPSAGS